MLSKQNIFIDVQNVTAGRRLGQLLPFHKGFTTLFYEA